MTKNKRDVWKRIVFFGMLVILAGMITPTGSLFGQPDIDSSQGEKELAIMKSVISTSIAMTRKSLRAEDDESRRGRYGRYEMDFDEDNVEAYYLHGQGVIFTIPYPCLAGRFPGEWDQEIDIRLDEIMEGALIDREQVAQEVEILMNEVELQRQELGLPHAVPPPPPPPEAPALPEAPESPEPDSAERKEVLVEIGKNMENSVNKLKLRLKEVREKSAEQKEKAEVEREAIKKELINVIAVHGGSLTQVRENEYINLILRDNCEFFDWGGSNASRTILSVKKSDITAYRSGRIRLDQLKLKFIEY